VRTSNPVVVESADGFEERDLFLCHQVSVTFFKSQAGFEIDPDGLLDGLAVRPRDVDQDAVHVKDEKADVKEDLFPLDLMDHRAYQTRHIESFHPEQIVGFAGGRVSVNAHSAKTDAEAVVRQDAGNKASRPV